MRIDTTGDSRVLLSQAVTLLTDRLREGWYWRDITIDNNHTKYAKSLSLRRTDLALVRTNAVSGLLANQVAIVGQNDAMDFIEAAPELVLQLVKHLEKALNALYFEDGQYMTQRELDYVMQNNQLKIQLNKSEENRAWLAIEKEKLNKIVAEQKAANSALAAALIDHEMQYLPAHKDRLAHEEVDLKAIDVEAIRRRTKNAHSSSDFLGATPAKDLLDLLALLDNAEQELANSEHDVRFWRWKYEQARDNQPLPLDLKEDNRRLLLQIERAESNLKALGFVKNSMQTENEQLRKELKEAQEQLKTEIDSNPGYHDLEMNNARLAMELMSTSETLDEVRGKLKEIWEVVENYPSIDQLSFYIKGAKATAKRKGKLP